MEEKYLNRTNRSTQMILMDVSPIVSSKLRKIKHWNITIIKADYKAQDFSVSILNHVLVLLAILESTIDIQKQSMTPSKNGYRNKNYTAYHDSTQHEKIGHLPHYNWKP